MSFAEPSSNQAHFNFLRDAWSDGQWGIALALPFLSLATPFIGHVTDRSYPLMKLEVWMILGGMLCASFLVALLRRRGRSAWYGMIVAATLTFFIDFQFEWMVQAGKYLVLGVFATMFLLAWRLQETFALVMTAFLLVFAGTTVVRASAQLQNGVRFAMADSATSSSALPRLIHLVLDEHIGIDGIPADWEYSRMVKEKLQRFYQQYGFMLYGGAYSRYWYTHNSIPNLFNFSIASMDRAFVFGDRPPYILVQNRYFTLLKDHGYQLHVIGGKYLDFCSNQKDSQTECTDYNWYSLKTVANQAVPVRSKISVLLGSYVVKYHRYQRVLSYYEDPLRPILLSYRVAVPAVDAESFWTRRHILPFSLNTMEEMDALSNIVLQLPRGHMLFAHLLLPHFPHVFKEDCSARPIAQSVDNMAVISEELRTSEGRSLRYDQYLRQIECLYVKLDDLFRKMQSAGLFDDTIIILHGDHGSRLGLHDPGVGNLRVLTDVDYADAFSTLFAVRISGKSIGYDPSLHAMDELFSTTLDVSLGSAPMMSISRSDPFVFLTNGDRKEQMLVPFPRKPPSVQKASAVK